MDCRPRGSELKGGGMKIKNLISPSLFEISVWNFVGSRKTTGGNFYGKHAWVKEACRSSTEAIITTFKNAEILFYFKMSSLLINF
jgi:hypothetical protein